jgi:two-component system sensor histidine kinase ChvG
MTDPLRLTWVCCGEGGMTAETEDMESGGDGSQSAPLRSKGWIHPVTLVRRMFGQSDLFQPDPPYPVSQSCGADRSGFGHSVSQSVPRGLIDARVESLLTQGEIIAGAVAASAKR